MVNKKKRYGLNRKKNSMLARLLLTISVLICIPLLLINVFIVFRDTKRAQEKEEEYYQIYTDNFRDFVSDELEKMFSCSVDISVRKSISYNDINENSKYLWNTFSEIKRYKDSISALQDLFIYIHGTDYVLGTENSYEDTHFAKRFMGKELDALECLPDSYENGKYFVKASDGKNGMFAVYPASVRKAGDTTVLFYITAQSLEDAFFIIDNDNTAFCIYNESGEMLLSNQKSTLSMLNQEEFNEFLQDYGRTTEILESTEQKWFVFKSYDGKNGLFYVTLVPETIIMHPIQNAKMFNILFLSFEFFLCIVMLLVVVYLNYQPIHMLRRKYLSDSMGSDVNEIEGITRLLDKTIADKHSLDNLLQERTEQLSTYVLRGMLNGEDIPEEQSILLSMNETIEYVFVMAVQGIDSDFDIERRAIEQLVEEANQDKILYSISDSYEHCVMYIGFMEKSDPEIRVAMAEKLKTFLTGEIHSNRFKLGVGEYCRLEDGLKTARLTALIALDQSVDGKIKYYENAVNEFKYVEYYPNKQMLTYMRYLKEGNCERSLAALREIIDYTRRNQPSAIMGRYVCYDIVNEFVQLITSLDIKVEEEKITKLMRFDRIEDLQEILSELTALASQEIENRKSSVEKEQVNKIIRFIDEHISDPDLSREMIADRYNISVNTVSLLCTNLVGMGFRELIVIRRIELAQKLFQETDLSVGEVAIQSGFRDTSYFIKVFKNITGKTPSVYKKEINL